ncbi:hypothetical protein ACFPPD_00190 [Cohnella suwonensis]|uniref:DUF2157 domain-containing protein n=1 Tax=Cohnella suwonensis TaxID=696072 RepID=A0ABW0LR14_9BACL
MADPNEEKRDMIVKEIESWRRNKLLPEQYCDFLQNIYLDDLNERPLGPIGNAVKKIGQASGKQWLLSFGSFALICVVVLHFSAFHPLLQIGLTVAAAAALTVIGARLRESAPIRAWLSTGAGMAFFAGVGYGIVELNGWRSESGTEWLIGCCAFVWIASGLALKSSILQGGGWLAAISLYALLLSSHVPDPGIAEVQVFWLPASLLFAWLSWYLHVKFKSAGAVLFATALVLWFMPEVYSALYGIGEKWIQAEIVAKILVAGLGMFRLRKQWMEWVA